MSDLYQPKPYAEIVKTIKVFGKYLYFGDVVHIVLAAQWEFIIKWNKTISGTRHKMTMTK